MPSLMHELGIDKITPEQRWQLLDELEESLTNGESTPSMTAAQRVELDRRIAAHEADPNRGSSWKQVRARTCGRED